MSYDLFFKTKAKKKAPAKKQLVSWFEKRPNYQAQEKQVFYGNDSTGVYFSFDLSGGYAFNMNYFRPHIFALEAEPEVKAFVDHFDFAIEDPQMDGMGEGAYSSEGFVRGWNAGNDFAVSAILSQEKKSVLAQIHTLPAKTIEAFWRWNVVRETLGGDVDVFVPRVSFGVVGKKLRSFVVWTDGIPILFPKVDLAVLVRAPEGEGEPELSLAEYERIAPILEKFDARRDPFPHRALLYKKPPKAIVQIFEEQKPSKLELKGVPVHQILDAELIAKHA